MSTTLPPQETPSSGLSSHALLAFFPSAHHTALTWIVDLPDDCDIDSIQEVLFALDGVKEINGGNPACGPQVLFSLPLEDATEAKLAHIAKGLSEILQANATGHATADKSTNNTPEK